MASIPPIDYYMSEEEKATIIEALNIALEGARQAWMEAAERGDGDEAESCNDSVQRYRNVLAEFN